MKDLIEREKAINAMRKYEIDLPTYAPREVDVFWDDAIDACCEAVEALPSAQPFHNITMNDVLKYIDDMPEDVWQEFTACLECRGWELQKRTAKWCRGEFA